MGIATQIFLSYARLDQEKINSLYHKLLEVGFTPWMDKKDILPGERWESAIQQAIRRCDFFLACLSRKSVDKRGFLQKEIRYALEVWKGKLDSDIYLIPVRLEDCDVPESLRDFQWVNLYEENGWTQLIKAIQVGTQRQEKGIEHVVSKSKPFEPLPTHSEQNLDMEITASEENPQRIQIKSSSAFEKTKGPQWWKKDIVAPIIVGIILSIVGFGIWVLQKSSKEKYGVTDSLSQPANKYYLRVTPFEGPKDSLSLEIELHFWQELREQAQKSESVKIVSGWDQMVKLLEYAEEAQRGPAIFDTSTILNPQLKAPNVYMQGTIRRLRQQEIELDIQILKIRTGEQIATGYARIPISPLPLEDASTPEIRQLILKLMESLDPKIKKQKAWLGEPFDPEKINILVADFTNFEGNVNAPGKQWAFKTFNELDHFMKADPALRHVVEVKRLYSDSTGMVIREETHAKEIGEVMNADMIIWGQNLYAGDSICAYAKASIQHRGQIISTVEKGVMHQMQLLRADLPMLIGAQANVLVKFIIGWTYLNDHRHQQFQNALRYLQQVLAEIDPGERQSILPWACEAAIYAGQYEPALNWCTELEREEIKSEDRAGLANTYNNIGAIYYKKGEWDKALEYCGKSEKILLEVGVRTGLADTYNVIGAIYCKKSEWDKALEYCGKSEKILLEVGDRASLANTYNSIGAIYDQKGEWNNALEYLDKSEKIRLEYADLHGLASTYNNIGSIYSKIGEWDKALEYLDKSRKILLENGDGAGLSHTYNGIGLIYSKKGDLDKAMEYYGKSEKIRLDVGDRAGLANIYNNIGTLCGKKGTWDKALEYYGKSEKLRLEIGDRVNLAATYNNIGSIYEKKGEWDKALKYYGKPEKIFMEVGDRAGLAVTYNNLATLYRKRENFNQAMQFGQRSLQITLQLGDLLNEKMAHLGLAQTLSKQKRYQEAIPHLERCVEIDQLLNHSDIVSDLQELLIMQMHTYSASGIRYELLDKFWAGLDDLQKGGLFIKINDWARATIYHQSYFKKSHDTLSLAEQAQIQNLIGVGYVKQSKGDSALPYLQAALQAYQQLGDQEIVGTLYNNLGSVQKMRKAWPEALAWLRKSVAHNRAVKGDSASTLGFTYYHLAEVFLHTQQPDSARYYVEKSLLLRQALKDTENVKQTRELRERILPAAAPKSSKK